MVLPPGVQPHDSIIKMAIEIGEWLNELFPLAQEQTVLARSFVINTWGGSWRYLPKLILLGPWEHTVPLLRGFGLLCPYSMLVGDITPAGLFEVCSRYRPTLLVADNGLSRGATRLLGAYSGFGSLQKDGIYPSSCARVIACPDLSRWHASLSDAPVIVVSESARPRTELLTDPDFLDWAAELQMKLLDYDLNLNEPLRPIEGDAPPHVRPDSWEIFRWWGSPFREFKGFQLELLQAIGSTANLKASALPIVQFAIIIALFFFAHKERPQVAVGAIRTLTDKVLSLLAEDQRISERKLGVILTRLGFPRRQRGGEHGAYQLEFNADTIALVHKLVKDNGLRIIGAFEGLGPHPTCRFCREFDL